MVFDVLHTTDYRYRGSASEAHVEARLTPPRRDEQEILSHRIEFAPAGGASEYEDHFGNVTTFYSMALRHDRLTVTNRMTVRTRPREAPREALGVPVAEARQIVTSPLTDVFDYLQPTELVPVGGEATGWAREFLRAAAPLGGAVGRLNAAVHAGFRYRPGATAVDTPLGGVWKRREGVCQDFAHVMLSVLRTAGIPARYVCGYIETDPPAGGAGRLVGAVATHAWVEVLVPGMRWVALDPTNAQWCGERHVSVSLGRDSADAAPVRGTFKGSGEQEMKVRVVMRRIAEKP